MQGNVCHCSANIPGTLPEPISCFLIAVLVSSPRCPFAPFPNQFSHFLFVTKIGSFNSFLNSSFNHQDWSFEYIFLLFSSHPKLECDCILSPCQRKMNKFSLKTSSCLATTMKTGQRVFKFLFVSAIVTYRELQMPCCCNVYSK